MLQSRTHEFTRRLGTRMHRAWRITRYIHGGEWLSRRRPKSVILVIFLNRYFSESGQTTMSGKWHAHERLHNNYLLVDINERFVFRQCTGVEVQNCSLQQSVDGEEDDGKRVKAREKRQEKKCKREKAREKRQERKGKREKAREKRQERKGKGLVGDRGETEIDTFKLKSSKWICTSSPWTVMLLISPWLNKLACLHCQVDIWNVPFLKNLTVWYSPCPIARRVSMLTSVKIALESGTEIWH